MQHKAAKDRSWFVTALGWFALIVGAPSFLARALGLVAVIAYPERARAMLSAGTNSIDRFVGDHFILIALMYAVGALLLFMTGVGLVRRRRWALRTGAVLLLFGFLRQTSALARTVLDDSTTMMAEPRFRIVMLGLVVVSLLWQAWLLWFFCRGSVQVEFEPAGPKVM
jgi:hypothetical protein